MDFAWKVTLFVGLVVVGFGVFVWAFKKEKRPNPTVGEFVLYFDHLLAQHDFIDVRRVDSDYEAARIKIKNTLLMQDIQCNIKINTKDEYYIFTLFSIYCCAKLALQRYPDLNSSTTAAIEDIIISLDIKHGFFKLPPLYHDSNATQIDSERKIEINLRRIEIENELKSQDRIRSKNQNSRVLIVLVLYIVAVFVVCAYIHTMDKTGTPVTSRSLFSIHDPTPTPTAAPDPIRPSNGTRLITPDYQQTCPLEIKADTGADYYVYLQYQYAPVQSQAARELHSTAKQPYESDLAFFVKSGQTVEINVPIGVYKFYYATGTTFYGTKLLFGAHTGCYVADELLTFNVEDDYYIGHTITLRKTTSGNFETDYISDSAFPTR